MPIRSSNAARLLAAIVLIALCTACVRREGRNSDCTWPGEAGATVLDPNQPAASRHLSADTEFAEELADRYTNVHFGPHSGYAGPPIAGRVRHECMVKMFQEIGKTHGVSTDQVIASFGRNRLGVDLAEILSFAALFALAASFATRRIWKRYPPQEDGWAAPVLIIALCSLGFGVAAALIGPWWTMILENFRVGTGHLGPRVMRLPMERYTSPVFFAGVGVCGIIGILCRPGEREEEANASRA